MEELEEDFVSLVPLAEDNDSDDDDDDANAATPQSHPRGQVASGSVAVSSQQQRLPPWMPHHVDYIHTNLLVALHNEIVQFCRLMEPREDEIRKRQELVDRFTKLAKECFQEDPTCRVQIFGSQATGLFLPESDIDIAIQLKDENKHAKKENGDEKKGKNGVKMENGEADDKVVSKQQELEDMEHWDKPTGSPLQRLAAALREKWLPELSYLEVIENTRVPLVKFTHAPTNISFDVCFNQLTGPQAAQLMHQYMEALPPLRPLTFVLKQFMASRSLNQPYTGGVGSFLLQMMIVSFLQHRERDAFNQRKPSLCNLGALLVEFFEFYSTDFNFILTGISVRFDGFFFPKGSMDRKKNFWQPNRPFSIAMENPLDPSHDVGSPSFRISTVQRSFEVAFKTLLCHVTEPIIPTVSLLASILPPWSYEDLWERSGKKTENVSQPLEPQQSGQHLSTHEPPRKRQKR
jgi:non-canonical poly(A) RNA polymerase PAPD5/7